MVSTVKGTTRPTGRVSPSLSVLASVVSATLAFSSVVAGKDLAPVDAWATAKPMSAAKLPQLGRGQLARFNGHIDARIGVPSFLWAGENATPQPRGPDAASPEAAARAHLKAIAGAYKLTASDIDGLMPVNTSVLKQGSKIVQLQNVVEGIEVFRERVAVLIDAQSRLVSVGGLISSDGGAGAAMRAPGGLAAMFRLSAADATAHALADYGFEASAAAQSSVTEGEGGYKRVALPKTAAGASLSVPARVKPVWFRLGTGLTPAYYVEVEVAETPESGTDFYAYVINAKSGETLFRHNQTANHSYTVFGETGGINLPLPGPDGRGAIPHPAAFPNGFQPPFVSPNVVTLERGPIADPTHIWLAPGATATTGNNADAYADLGLPDGFDTDMTGIPDVRGATNGVDTFNYTYDTALAPAANANQIQASIANLFYINNWLHDFYYDAGFDEASGNAQTVNYSGMGIAGDNIRAEAQDSSGTNNANMSTPADGGRPRMQMYVWSGIAPSSVTLSGNSTAVLGPVGVATGFGPQSFDAGPLEVVQLLDTAVTGVAPVPPLTTDGCDVVTNAAAVAGKIALVDRGNCAFTTKVLNAQNAGALGVIIGNIDVSIYAAPAQTFGNMGGTSVAVTIPALLVALPNATTLRTAMGGGTVNARLQRPVALNRDGTLDNGIVAHEWGHYISNRLVQNSAGLTNQVGRGMGEGWADFHAMLMNVKADDDQLAYNLSYAGTYAVATYSLSGPSPAFAPNNAPYYGIRRFAYSTNFNRNPLTFAHIDDSVVIPATAPRSGAGAPQNAAVHNTGEVWASMLWECYASLLKDSGRLTFEEAQDRMKRYVIAGYKLTPPAPTMLEARDAILSAMLAEDAQDFQLCGLAFARRGAGSGAIAPDRFSTTNIGTVQSFAFGPAAEVASVTFDDANAACDADGIVDNTETGTLRIAVRNAGFLAMTNTTATISSPTVGVSFPSGTTIAVPAITPLSSSTIDVPVTLTGFSGISEITIDVEINDPGLGSAGPVIDQYLFRVNADLVSSASLVDDAESPDSAWTVALTNSTNPLFYWGQLEYAPLDHTYYGPDAGATLATWFVSPSLALSVTDPFVMSYDSAQRFEAPNYDGGVVEFSTDGGANWADITTLVGATLTPAYDGALDAANAIGARQAYLATNAAWPNFETMSVNIPGASAVAGQTIKLRFGVAADPGVADYGWEIDNVTVSGVTNLPFNALVPHVGGCNSGLFTDGFEEVTR